MHKQYKMFADHYRKNSKVSKDISVEWTILVCTWFSCKNTEKERIPAEGNVNGLDAPKSEVPPPMEEPKRPPPTVVPLIALLDSHITE